MTLEATVVVVPADVTSPPDVTVPLPAPRYSPALIRPPRPGAARGGLAAAVRCINEGAEALAETRRNANHRA